METLRPLRGQLPGFEGAWLLLDGRTGQSTAILLWSDEVNLNAGEASPLFQTQLERLAAAFAGTPSRAALEMVVQV